MKTYRVKYTLEKVVVVDAKNPQDAVNKAATLEDFNYEFYNDYFLAEEMQEKSISTALYIKGKGITEYSRKVVPDIPNEDRSFDNVHSIEYLQETPQYLQIRIATFNLKPVEIINMIEQICENKLRIN